MTIDGYVNYGPITEDELSALIVAAKREHPLGMPRGMWALVVEYDKHGHPMTTTLALPKGLSPEDPEMWAVTKLAELRDVDVEQILALTPPDVSA